MLRAFNGDCDSLISKVNWSNIDKMEERIRKAKKDIEKMNEDLKITLSVNYLNLKLQELWLTHELANKIREEKEEQRRIREQIREEEKLRKEIEKAMAEAKKEEEQFKNAIDMARTELEQASEGQKAALLDKIQELEERLHEAEEKEERAISRAQMTKSGYVYVISNIGSFGENIYKIGLTRRLEPMDRVKELGDASVPFTFDVHAMIYSEDAPKLENTLHNTFVTSRMNRINPRKEFFKISLDEIEEIAKKHDGKVEFTKIAEAREYRESLALSNPPMN